MNQISRDEIRSFMEKYHVDYSIADVTPTICALFGLNPPDVCGGQEIAEVIDQAGHIFGEDKKIERALIYCPDAVGDIHRQRYPQYISRVEKLAGMRFLSSCVMPSVTPVCFGTIFSGASPQVHGIQKYEKKVLEIPTIFDVFAEAGKRVAIVATNTCSVDTIFRKRRIEYYSTCGDARAYEITRRLIERDEYDMIISYYTSFDHISHKQGAYSPAGEAALRTAVEYFETLVADVDKFWGKYDRVVTWTPDHGNHDIEENKSAHGKDIPEDMVVNHYYRLRGKNA